MTQALATKRLIFMLFCRHSPAVLSQLSAVTSLNLLYSTAACSF
jgi:hypothetical protein